MLESQAPESPWILSQFSLNIDEVVGGSSFERPIGIKKTKLKRKLDEKFSSSLNRLNDDNAKITEMFEMSTADRPKVLEMQSKNLALQEMKYEEKFLMRDLNAITD